mmetsp:Transcript_38329/g.122074  ORF Transcript_38329/g.122074 Transcript_38329/m.122074 type:complete len:204 (-) Transcript_38329:3359-3970(-)
MPMTMRAQLEVLMMRPASSPETRLLAGAAVAVVVAAVQAPRSRKHRRPRRLRRRRAARRAARLGRRRRPPPPPLLAQGSVPDRCRRSRRPHRHRPHRRRPSWCRRRALQRPSDWRREERPGAKVPSCSLQPSRSSDESSSYCQSKGRMGRQRRGRTRQRLASVASVAPEERGGGAASAQASPLGCPRPGPHSRLLRPPDATRA